jgi:hypothetical protein
MVSILEIVNLKAFARRFQQGPISTFLLTKSIKARSAVKGEIFLFKIGDFADTMNVPHSQASSAGQPLGVKNHGRIQRNVERRTLLWLRQ